MNNSRKSRLLLILILIAIVFAASLCVLDEYAECGEEETSVCSSSSSLLAISLQPQEFDSDTAAIPLMMLSTRAYYCHQFLTHFVAHLMRLPNLSFNLLPVADAQPQFDHNRTDSRSRWSNNNNNDDGGSDGVYDEIPEDQELYGYLPPDGPQAPLMRRVEQVVPSTEVPQYQRINEGQQLAPVDDHNGPYESVQAGMDGVAVVGARVYVSAAISTRRQPAPTVPYAPRRQQDEELQLLQEQSGVLESMESRERQHHQLYCN